MTKIKIGISSPDYNNKNAIINFIILASTILLGLIFAEILFRLIAPIRQIKIGTALSEKAKIYGWAHLPNKREVLINPDTASRTYYTTNSEGWRDVEHTFEKPAGTIRILFLGDSNTWGYVPLDSLYTRRIEILLKQRGFKNVEVISIGAGGWGTDQLLEVLEREGVRYHPDFVIYQFCDNDVIDNLSPSEGRDLEGVNWQKVFRYNLEGNALKKIRLEPHEPIARSPIKSFLLKSALIYHANDVKNKAYNWILGVIGWRKELTINPFESIYMLEENDFIRQGWRLLEFLVIRMNKVCEDNGAKFIIFAFTGESGQRQHEIKFNNLKTDGSLDCVLWGGKKIFVDIKKPYRHLNEICRRDDIVLIEPKREYVRFNSDPHPNDIGNNNMASDLVDFLIGWQPFCRKYNLESNFKYD